MDEVDCVVIGAGVVGLAVARALALRGREVVILERAGAFGTETSARNSEVIHAGIHYSPGSLKARMCLEGRDRLYRFAEAHGVAHRRCGKLIVATSAAQEPALEQVMAHAAACGVSGLRRLDPAEVAEREPSLRCTRAVFSPDTGIIDSHGFMQALLAEAEAQGAVLACATEVTGGRITGAGIEIATGDYRLRARGVVNAAGHGAAAVAAGLGLAAAEVPRMHFARGTYFAADTRHGFSHLVYPVPEPGGLGVHLTLDLGGAIRFGPDVEWIDGVDYTLSDARRAHFETEIRRYWPGLPEGCLHPSYCGVRPKLAGPGAPAADFSLRGPGEHGIPGLVNLFGIESPGLTSALALAEAVADRLA